MLLDKIRDDQIVSRRAVRFFVASSLFVVGLTAFLLTGIDPAKLPFWYRLPITILVMLAVVATFSVWIGMWRFWIRLDRSSKAIRRMWFVLLLIGFWWSSCLYLYIVYFPTVRKKQEWQV
jgi:hypothetical protein